jgi:methionine-gamma-lyase
MRLSTKSIHAGLKTADPTFGSVVPPIFPTSTFAVPDADEGSRRYKGESDGMVYSRFTNPTVRAFEERLAAIEEGEDALATSSGMAAISLTLMHYLKAGDTLLLHTSMYGATYHFALNILPRYGIQAKCVNFNDHAALEAALDDTVTALIFESPTNPTIELIDIERITTLARSRGILTIFDNSFAAPPLQYPLKHGIDIVCYSVTKALNGHSDVIAGAIVGAKDRIEPIRRGSFNYFGPAMSPFTAYLAMRGMETLEIRVMKQSENAMKVAEFLRNHPAVSKVNYPGFADHPQHELMKKQMLNAGSIFSFELKGGFAAGKQFVNTIEIIHHAVSIGSVESLTQHPASMTHGGMTDEERAAAGINGSLVRLSVGIEDPDDLIAALRKALDPLA